MEYIKSEILEKILKNDNLAYKRYKTYAALWLLITPTTIIITSIVYANLICGIDSISSALMVVITFFILALNLIFFYFEKRWFYFLKNKKDFFLKKETKIMKEILWENRVEFREERKRLIESINSLNNLNEIFKSLEISFALEELEWYLKKIDDFYKKCNYSEEVYYDISPKK